MIITSVYSTQFLPKSKERTCPVYPIGVLPIATLKYIELLFEQSILWLVQKMAFDFKSFPPSPSLFRVSFFVVKLKSIKAYQQQWQNMTKERALKYLILLCAFRSVPSSFLGRSVGCRKHKLEVVLLTEDRKKNRILVKLLNHLSHCFSTAFNKLL